MRRLSARSSRSTCARYFTLPFLTRIRAPHILVEALTGDFGGNLDHAAVVARSGLDVFAHNVETTEALTPFVRDRRASFRRSLAVLKRAKEEGVRVTKTSIMLGLGEKEEDLMDALRELRKANVDVVTFGQYMRPTKRHMKVERYIEPAEFERWKQVAEDMGFLYVASGPLVRSSYKVCTCIFATPPDTTAHARFRLASTSLRTSSAARAQRRRPRSCSAQRRPWAQVSRHDLRRCQYRHPLAYRLYVILR